MGNWVGTFLKKGEGLEEEGKTSEEKVEAFTEVP